jgi:phosphoserine aminotransferase
MSKIHNFSAGPAILPQEAINSGVEALQNFAGTGLSILEVSHRGKEFVQVMDEARSMVKELFGLNDDYDVMYLQGGASTQFLMVAYNLLQNKAAYFDTGTWAAKSLKEAQMIGQIDVVASSKDKNYNYIPKNYQIDDDVDYVHYTSNNTIFGSQFHFVPETNSPLICDMSSDIFSRNIDAAKYDLIYAGAQKNLGPAGTTVVVIKKELLGRVSRVIPTMLNYQTHLSKESMFNTPPVFSVYVVLQTLKWIKNRGLNQIEADNKLKAETLYSEIDRNELFIGTVEKEDRSWMNATFLLKEDAMNDGFMKAVNEARISGLKGHRSVGGYRASMYNALTIDSVQALVDVMQNFKP